MCGILSVYDPAGCCASDLRAGIAAIGHRGPDATGVWVSPDRTVGLGHTRLAVIDLLTGDQPILNEDGSIAVVVNGEFYEFEQVRRELTGRGHRLRTAGDSEIALHLYEEHGLGFLDHLRGEFALVLWDGRERRLVAARDRFGVKPLCWRGDGQRLLLASEAKALFALGVRPAWDEDTVFQVCGMQYPPPDRTLFADIRQLQPGHFLVAEHGTVRTAAYWDIDYVPEAKCFSEECVPAGARELRDALDESVRLRLRSDVPVCFHLSGGLDSTAVVSLAAPHLAAAPVCFTVGFDAGPYDELELARKTAEFFGTDLRPVAVSQRDQLDHLSDAIYYSEGLAINGHLPAKFLLARAIRRAGYKVVLSGEGSDEVFGGYAHLRQDLLENSPAARMPRTAVASLHANNAVMAGIHLPEGDGLPLDAVRERVGFLPTFLRAKATLGLRLRRLLRRDFLARFAGRDPYRHFLDYFDTTTRLSGRHPVNQSSYLWSKSSLATYILRTLGDGTEMAHALEGRLPFLDHRLFEFARQLPVGLKIRGDQEKFLLREAVGPLLPPEVRARRKHPFTAPPLSQPNPTERRSFRDLLDCRSLADSPFFDARAVQECLDDLPALPEREQTATDPALMLVLSTVLAQQRFGL
jgi:asparagine synthase (glutamine-hydrolysing)